MGNSYVVGKIGAELNNALILRGELEVYEDPQLIQDAIEGETNLHEALAVVLELIGEEEMMLAGIQTKLDELQTRSARIASTIQRYRAAVTGAMTKAEIKSVKTPLGTISMRDGKRQVVITDQSRLPDAAYIVSEPKVSPSRLRALLEDGPVNGAEWSNGTPILVIKRT